ncbi:MAG: metal-dependent hydrolase [Methanomicrobiales archaeon]
MDLITHFIVPYIILFFAKSKYKLEGALGGISIDFDTFIVFVGILFPQLFIFTHRGITHSFIFGFISALIFLFIITRNPIQNLIGRLIRRDLNLKFTKKTILLAYFGVLIHLLLDFLTTGGIPLFYPISITRFSAEIYSYIDPVTTLAALVVLATIYFKIDVKYKKAVMIIFMVMLISFGGIRIYEKNDAINSLKMEMNDNFTQIEAYPTSDMFLWQVVLIDPEKQYYKLYEYNGINGNNSFNGNFQTLTIKNGSYQSAVSAVNQADQLIEVKEFRWQAFYTCVDAQYENNQWKLTYYDFIGSYSTRNNLTVYIK